MRMKRINGKVGENPLWKVNETKSDRKFIKNLSQWILKHYGNVNVAQRLNVINIKYINKSK